MELLEIIDAPRTGGTLRDAIAEVRSALPSSPESEAAKRRILDFVSGHDDALHRSCVDGHLTGSALVVDAARARMLLMLHTKLGLWLQPGGHADGEGHLGAVALREATEETGIEHLRLVAPPIDCDVHLIPDRPGEPAHLHLDVRYLVLAPPDAEECGNHESQELRWVTPDEVHGLATDASLLRLAQAAFAAATAL